MTNRQKKCVQFVLNLLEIEEFNLYIDKGEYGNKVFKLTDLQGGNLGDIEGDELLNLGDVIERLDTYHGDYIYETIETFSDERTEYAVYLESDRVAKTLSKITPEMFENEEEFKSHYVLNIN